MSAADTGADQLVVAAALGAVADGGTVTTSDTHVAQATYGWGCGGYGWGPLLCTEAPLDGWQIRHLRACGQFR